MSVFFTDFTGASDPSLVPIPFDSVVEGAGCDCLYDATNGIAGGPCERSLILATGADAYGIRALSEDIALANRKIRLTLAQWKCDVVPFAGISGSRSGLLRLRNPTPTNLCTLELVKVDTTNARFRVRYDPGASTADGTTNIVAATNYKIAMEYDGRAGLETLTLFVNDLQEAQITGLGASVESVHDLLCGAIAITGIPAVTINYYSDNINLTTMSAAVATSASRQHGTVRVNQVRPL